jgi:arylsulfatase A-like enzyme
MYARVNNTSDGESARPQAQRSPRCMRPLAYWYSALIMRQSQVSLFAHSAAIHPVTNTDVMPTILNMVQAGPAPQPCDGVDISGLLRGQAGLDRDALYWHYPHYSDQGGTPSGAIREGDWKLIEFFEDGHVELYNLALDPGEQYNFASRFADRATELVGKLRVWRESVNASMPRPNPEYNAVDADLRVGPAGCSWNPAPGCRED